MPGHIFAHAAPCTCPLDRFQSELFAFSVGWDIFSGHNDGRGVGDPHFVPWTSANGAYGVAQLCLVTPEAVASLPPACALGVPLPPC